MEKILICQTDLINGRKIHNGLQLHRKKISYWRKLTSSQIRIEYKHQPNQEFGLLWNQIWTLLVRKIYSIHAHSFYTSLTVGLSLVIFNFKLVFLPTSSIIELNLGENMVMRLNSESSTLWTNFRLKTQKLTSFRGNNSNFLNSGRDKN